MRVEGAAMEIRRPVKARRQPPSQVIIFDGDDTLWATQWLYDQAETETRLIIESAGLDAVRWTDIYRERDLGNVAKFGFNSGRLPTSVVGAYVQLCEESATPVRLEVLRELLVAATSMFRRRAPLVSGAAEVLEALRPDYQLVLVTKGDAAVQRKRIRESGLEKFFDAIFIVPDKNAAVYRAVCADVGADLARSWSVGNSLASDVVPAMSVGLQGVLLEANSWEFEKRDPGPIPGVVERLARLRDLPALLLRKIDGPMRRHMRGEGLAS